MKSIASEEVKSDRAKRRIVSAAELFRKPGVPTRWLVAGLLSPGVTVFSAAPKDGKSVFALQLAAAVAAGKPFLELQTKQARVLYISLDELSDDVIKQQGYPFFEDISNLDLSFGWDGGNDELVKRVQARRYEVVVLDTLQKWTTAAIGGYGKDSLKLMAPLTAALQRVGHDVALIAIHHAGKTERDWTKAGYGSNGIAGGATNVWHLSKATNAPEEGPYAFNAKGRTIRHVALRLMRKLHYFDTFKNPKDPNEDSHAFEWIVDDRAPPPDTSGTGRTVTAILRALEDADEGQWISQADLLRQVEARGIPHSRQVIVRQIDKLVAEGEVFRQGSARRSSYLHRDRVPAAPKATRPRLRKKERPRLNRKN